MDEFLWNKILLYYEHPTAAMIRPYITEYNIKTKRYGEIAPFHDQTLFTIMFQGYKKKYYDKT